MRFLKAALFSPIMLACLVACLLATACQPAAAAKLTDPATPEAASAATLATAPAEKESIAGTPAITTSPTEPTFQLWLPGYLPGELSRSIELPPGLSITRQESAANLSLVVLDNARQGSKYAPWVYALVAPFPTVEDEFSLNDLRDTWRKGPGEEAKLQKLLVDRSTRAIFEILWGPASSAVRTLPASGLLDAAWKERSTWAIIPFEQLEPRWKVVAVDGQSPIHKTFDPNAYGLTVYFGLEGQAPSDAVDQIQLSGNYQPDRLTTVVLTGVTALVRGTATLMESRGMTYPAQDIGDWLREADILHINNEVPFASNCPQPFDWEGLVFCSQPDYIELLESIGTDVVELSGDHFQDWGPEATLYTIDLYEGRGWPYYGGGRNAADAMQPVLFEHNGNRIAFTGCNAKPPGYSGASETTPGAVHCDFDQMVDQVRRLKKDGYLPIVTFQHLEYYSYTAHPILQKDFALMAEAGAVIVSGSQAHQPHALEFKNDALLHYGLGNLFFDQTNQGEPPRTAFIDRHVFYNGRHVSTELLTIYFVNWARARPMTPTERQALLQTIFEASGWDPGSP